MNLKELDKLSKYKTCKDIVKEMGYTGSMNPGAYIRKKVKKLNIKSYRPSEIFEDATFFHPETKFFTLEDAQKIKDSIARRPDFRPWNKTRDKDNE